MNDSLKIIIVNWIKNINTRTQIGFLLVAGAIILAIIGVLLLDKYKDSGIKTSSKANRINLLATILYGTVLMMIEVGVAFVLLS